MEILEAFVLTNSHRAAGELTDCCHHTVEHYVTMRDQGLLPDGDKPVERPRLTDGFMPKIEDSVERSGGRIRGDVVVDRLVGLGVTGSALDQLTLQAVPLGNSDGHQPAEPLTAHGQMLMAIDTPACHRLVSCVRKVVRSLVNGHRCGHVACIGRLTPWPQWTSCFPLGSRHLVRDSPGDGVQRRRNLSDSKVR